MPMTILGPLVLALALQQAAPAAPAPSTSAQAGASSTAYRIGPADALLITITGEDTLSGKFIVDSDGMFSFPYLNRVRASGMTAAELQERLASLLRAGYL